MGGGRSAAAALASVTPFQPARSDAPVDLVRHGENTGDPSCDEAAGGGLVQATTDFQERRFRWVGEAKIVFRRHGENDVGFAEPKHVPARRGLSWGRYDAL